MAPLNVVLSSGAEFFTTKELVQDVMPKIVEMLPADTVYLTGGCTGPAFEAAKIAKMMDRTVIHMIPTANWEYPEYGLVEGAAVLRVGKDMDARLKIMANTGDVSIAFEGGIGTILESLIIHRNGGTNVFFPEGGFVQRCLLAVKTNAPTPKAPTYLNDKELKQAVNFYGGTQKKGVVSFYEELTKQGDHLAPLRLLMKHRQSSTEENACTPE